MDSDSTITVVFIVIAVLAYLALHAAETALPLLRRGSVRDMTTGHSLREAAVRNLRASRYQYEDVVRTLRLTSIAAIFSLSLALFWVQLEWLWPATLISMVGLSVFLLLLRPLIVKQVAGLSDALLIKLGVPIQILLWPALPLSWLSYRALRAGRRAAEAASGNGSTLAESRTEEEEEVAEDLSSEELEPEERRMIYAILHLEDTAVREIMVPRVDVVALEVDTSLDQVIDRVLDSGHSRVPVYQESLDNVVGILYSRDLLEATARHIGAQAALRDLVRPAFFIPEAKRVDELLREFQERHLQIAVVVDEFGGVAGIITIEDLVEEIVGEIEDEFDTTEPTIERDERGQALVDARIEVDAFNEAFHATIGGEGFETLGGFLYSHLGKIPSPGDLVTANGLQMEVVTTVGRRIKKVRVLPLGARDESSPGDGGQPLEP